MMSVCVFTFDNNGSFQTWTRRSLSAKLAAFRGACHQAMDPDRIRVTSRLIVGPEYLFCHRRWIRAGDVPIDRQWHQMLADYPGSLRDNNSAHVLRSNAYSRRARDRYEQSMLALSLSLPGTLVMPGTVLWSDASGHDFSGLILRGMQHLETAQRIGVFYGQVANLLTPTGGSINYADPRPYMQDQLQNPNTHITSMVRNTAMSWWQGEQVHVYDKILDSGECLGTPNAMFLSGDYSKMLWTLNGKRIRQYICMDHHLVARDPVHAGPVSDLTVFMSGSEAEQNEDFWGVDRGGVFVHADTDRNRCHVRCRSRKGDLAEIEPELDRLISGLRVLRFRAPFDLHQVPTGRFATAPL